MADESKSKIEESKTESKKIQKPEEIYYFYSVGCGWCKKTEPIVDELIGEGYNILKLDLAEADNREVQQEMNQKYSKQCGTPWLIDPATGNDICGFREKDIIQKLANGEEIPAPPRPTGPPPKPPLFGAPQEEEDKWKKEYDEWAEKNKHMPNIQTAEQILSRPRPKTEPPKPPVPNATDADIDKWGDEYEKWRLENDHLPNLQPKEQMVQRFKQRGQQQGAPGAPAIGGNVEQRLSTIEAKLDALVKHLGVKDIPSPTVPPVQKQKPPSLPPNKQKGSVGPPANKKKPKRKRNKKSKK
tara:strand:+ start:2040 stop:2936 length:897 start_codon:yes stop_codon:yes gene_type:complete